MTFAGRENLVSIELGSVVEERSARALVSFVGEIKFVPGTGLIGRTGTSPEKAAWKKHSGAVRELLRGTAA